MTTKQRVEDFFCCGGSDETPMEHTQDCEEHGNPEWIAQLAHFDRTGRSWTMSERNKWRKEFKKSSGLVEDVPHGT